MYQVLLVDDEPILQMGIRKMLEKSEKYGICATARNGVEALQYLQNNPVDIILTDLKMPVMDGVTLIKKLQEQKHPSPIIVLSNYSDFVLVREALTSGAKDYVLKLDLTKETLLAHLDKLAEQIQNTVPPSAEQKPAQEELLRSRLRNYFREPQAEDSPLPDLPSNLLPPFLVFTVYFPKGRMSSDRIRKVLPHIETVLRTALDGANLLPLLLHHNELLCLVGSSDIAWSVEDSLKLLQRQLSTYFSVTPILCYCTSVESLPQAKESYELCRQAYGMSFYGEENTLLQAKRVQMAQSVPPEQFSCLVSGILDALHIGDLEKAFSSAHKEFMQWKQCCLAPERARITCLRIVDSIRYSVAINEAPESFSEHQSEIEKASTLEGMEAHFQTALQLLTQYKGRPFESHKREVQEVLRYLHTYYGENITLESLAETTCLNRSYLCRVFKKEMGMSIFSYLNVFRMKQAEQLLLKDDNLYIKEVATQVGIDDPFYFTRRFKEYFGMSPKEYVETKKT